MSKRIATIKDVAASAKVSTATVSNVLHGKNTLYSPDTARSVWDAVQALGYRPNRIARSLVRRATDTLGVVVDRPHGRLTHNPYMSQLMDGFLEYASAEGYQIKLISLLMQDPRDALAQLDDGSVDGLALFAPPSDSPLLSRAVTIRVPIVAAGSVPSGMPFASVDLDDERAGYEATQYLIGLGHRRIALIGGPASQASSRRREAGYCKALTQAGLEPDPRWRYEGSYAPESAVLGVEVLMQTSPAPSAIVFWNDGMAIEGIRRLQEMGYRIPEDVSLLGFDDSEVGRWIRPTLTTVQQPVSEMGKKAAKTLLRQINTGVREEGIELFEGRLIVRASTAAPTEPLV